MPIDPKTITVFLDASPSGERRAAQAAAFAQRWGAHLVGVYVVFKGVTPHPSMAYARSEKAIAGVIAHERRLDDACECTTAEVGEQFPALCAELGVSAEFRPIHRDKTAEAAIINSLHSDLLVIGHPEPSGLPDDVSAEKILLASGVPLLIVPNDWKGETHRRADHDRLERQPGGAARRLRRHELPGRGHVGDGADRRSGRLQVAGRTDRLRHRPAPQPARRARWRSNRSPRAAARSPR